MRVNNRFFNFVFACIPGAGLMYNGLIKVGVEILVAFIAVISIGTFAGMEFMIPIFIIPIWFYSFFKTFEVTRIRERGELLEDKSIIFSEGTLKNELSNNSMIKIVAILFIAIGAIALLNKLLHDFAIYWEVREYLSPVIFIGIGIYILIKRK